MTADPHKPAGIGRFVPARFLGGAAARGQPGAPDAAGDRQRRLAAGELALIATMDNGAVLARLRSSMAGLSGRDAQTRLAEHGLNRPRSSQEVSFVSALWSRLCNPLNGLLVALALLSWRLSDAGPGR